LLQPLCHSVLCQLGSLYVFEQLSNQKVPGVSIDIDDAVMSAGSERVRVYGFVG